MHFRLAELRTEVECLRALTYRAVEQYVGGKDVTRLASMAKLKAGRLSREVADSCLQYWGGMGFTADNPIAQSYRDANGLVPDEPHRRTVEVDAFCSWSACSVKMRSTARSNTGLTLYSSHGVANIMCRKLPA